MSNTSGLGELEIVILNLIWDHPGSSVRELHDLCKEQKPDIARTTVLTIVQRLESKGFIRRNKEGRSATFAAIEKRDTVLKRLSSRFIESMLGGSIKPALHSFLSSKPDKEEIEELQKMLDEFKRKEGDES